MRDESYTAGEVPSEDCGDRPSTTALRVAFDTTTINRLADHDGTLEIVQSARGAGLIEVMVHAEIAFEVRKTQEPERLAKLESVLQNFFPLTPTRVPRMGIARIGLMRLPTEEDERRLDDVQFLRGGFDQMHVTNAAGDRCHVFITNDDELWKKKRGQLEPLLAGVRVITFEVFIEELKALLTAQP